MKRIYILLKQAQNGWYHFDVPAEDVDHIVRNLDTVVEEVWISDTLDNVPQGTPPDEYGECNR